MTHVAWTAVGCLTALLALSLRVQGQHACTRPGEMADGEVRRNCWPLPSACPRGNLPAYAHNDYRNAVPLHEALVLGYRGVEADVYLVNGVLRLGHDRREAQRGASLEQRYLAPLDSLLSQCGDGAATKSLLLFVELKEASRESYDSLVVQLARYPRVARAMTPVLVGWHPAPAVLDSAPVHIGRQFRLDRAATPPGAALDAHVQLLSVDYGKTFGRWWVRSSTRRRWLDALQDTKKANPTLLLRVHNVPVSAPVYQELCAAGVDLIGTKSLARTAVVMREAISCKSR